MRAKKTSERVSARKSVSAQKGVVRVPRDRELDEANRRLREANAQFQAMWEQGLFAGRLDLKGNVLDANRACVEGCGFTRKEIIGRPFWECGWWNRAPEIQEWVRRAVQEAIAGQAFRGESRYFLADGTERVVDFACMPIKDTSGKVIFVVPTGMDITESVQAERNRRALEEERLRLQELLAQAPAGIGLLHGPEHRWTYVNDQYVRMTGRSGPADFIGRTLRDSLPEIDSHGFARLLDEVYRTGEPYIGREMMAKLNRAAKGLPEETYFDFVYQPMRDAEGKVGGVLVHCLEVTDKVVARKAIEETAERLRLAQTAAQVGTWEWDPAEKTQNLSPELHRIFGTEATDPERVEKWASRVFGADWPKVQQLMQEGHRSGEMEFEYRYEHPTSGLRWFYCKGRRQPGETRMLGVVLDITARKTAEEASHRLAAIVESSDDAIISKDLNGIVTSWNPCAEKIFGYTAEEMIGRPITTIIPPELRSDETRILAAMARGERIEHFETVRVKKSGEQIEVSLTVSPIRDEAGKVIGAAKIARDITQTKKSERALRTTERLASVGRLAATVAHEINNPLEAVTNLIYLARHAAVRTNVQGYLDAAEQELVRISHLTKQTLGFYRDSKGPAEVGLGTLVSSLMPMFSARTRNKGIELCSEIDDDTEVFAVTGEIRQVIANLVSNSIDAVDAGGRVRIRVSAATRWNRNETPGVRLTVADTGSGIPNHVRPRIFEPFFTTKRDVGTGLGLWVCKSIVENHHGSIQVKSVATPGKSWTVFSVFLPSSPREAVTEVLSRVV